MSSQEVYSAASDDPPDSVPLEALSSPGAGPRLANLKILVALFIVFITVVSDAFTNSVVAGFGDGAVRGRSPTAWGVVLQGVFIVIFYTIAVYLIEHRVL